MSGWELAAVAAVVLAYAATSRLLDRTPVTAAIFFVSCGFVLGDKGLGWIDLGAQSESVRLLAEVTLTLVLFADASRLDLAALRREYLVPARLLGLGLPLTILVGFGLAAAIFPKLSLGEALLLAIILAPTDAALGQAVVTDPRLPSRIRQGLNVESGLNDGICVPLLFIALALERVRRSPRRVARCAPARREGDRLRRAVRRAQRCRGRVAAAGGPRDRRGGGLVGPGRARWRRRRSPTDLPRRSVAAASSPPSSRALSSERSAVPASDATYLVEELGGLANAGTFIVFGAAIVGPILAGSTWTTALYAVLSLTVVRMLPVAAAFAGTHARLPTVAFVGWFGPRGLASIVFTVIVLDETKLPYDSTIATVVVFTIVLSIFAHGLTSKPLTARYASWYRAHPRDRRPAMEAVHASSQRWRRETPGPGASPR